MNRVRRGSLLGLAVFLAGCAGHAPPSGGAAAADGDPRTPPAARAMESIALPEIHERTLDNGARVIIVPQHERPVVTVSLRIASGSAADPRGRAGVASFTASLLDKGTETRSADEIARTIDFVGGELGAGADADWTRITTTSLTEFVDTALVLLSDVALRPTFPEDELQLHRRRTLSSLRVQLGDPGAVAQRRFLREVYGEHPYGRRLTPEAVRSIDRDDLVRFHRTHVRPDNALFVVAGDVDPDTITSRLERHFGDWTAAAAPADREPPAPPERGGREIVLVHKPGSVQAVVRAGHLLPSATHADWEELDIMLQVLGGGSTGWLFDVLREQKGYTYGAYARASKREQRGYVQATAEVRNEVADSALTELFGLLDRIRDEPVPAEDLRLAKAHLTGRFPLRIETPQQIAGWIANARMLGLPHDYIATYRDRLAAVDADDVQRVAREHLHPDRAVVVVVGDATEIYDAVAALGDVRLVDVEGRELSPADVGLADPGAALDATALEERTLSYDMVVDGEAVGEANTTIAFDRVDGREAVRVRTEGGGTGFMVRQDLVLDRGSVAPISARVEQSGGRARIASDLRYEDGAVRGTIDLPGADARDIDVDVPPGTLLPGMDEVAVWLTDFSDGPVVTRPAFNIRTGAPTTLRFTLVGDTTITVPAGEFEAYEVKLAGGPVRARLFVRMEAPHYVLRQKFLGQPLVVELRELR